MKKLVVLVLTLALALSSINPVIASAPQPGPVEWDMPVSAFNDLGLWRDFTEAYGLQEHATLGEPGPNGIGIDLMSPMGVMGGTRWYISESQRNYEIIWGTGFTTYGVSDGRTIWGAGISRYGLNWLPVLGAEVYLDLAWSSAQIRDLAEAACGLLEDAYTLSANRDLFRSTSRLAKGLVEEYREVEAELMDAVYLRREIVTFAEAILASGGIDNPLLNGRPYPAPGYSVLEGVVSKQSLDDFIVNTFGQDCIPRSADDMPWSGPSTEIEEESDVPIEVIEIPDLQEEIILDIIPEIDFFPELEAEELEILDFTDGSEIFDFVDILPAEEFEVLDLTVIDLFSAGTDPNRDVVDIFTDGSELFIAD